MTSNSLPRQIVVLVLAVLLAVLSVLWVSLYSVRAAMDADARIESQRRLAGRIAAFQEQVALIASDYHNWTDLFLDGAAQDRGSLASNYGITAVRGEVFQYAELFDGPFAQPLSWEVGKPLTGQGGILLPAVRARLRQAVPELAVEDRQTFDFIGMRDGVPVMFSSSYLLPEDADLLSGVDRSKAAIATIGKVIEPARLAAVAKEFGLADMRILQDPNQVEVVLPLLGVEGEPISWLAWVPPHPGTDLFWKMFPIMSGVSMTFVLISYMAARLLRSKAAGLIEREAISYGDARTDALTKLPNRFALREHLDCMSERAECHVATIAIDLVRFKQINDTVGHLGGDTFLVEFAQRIAGLADETTFVSRFGGDEFLIAISTTGDIDRAVQEKSAALLALGKKPIRCAGVLFDVLSSKGVATSHGGRIDLEELLRRADRAMYAAKARGTQEVVVYDSRMEVEDIDQKRIERELRKALQRPNGFSIHFQPIVSADHQGPVRRYEALARWTSPELGPVSPAKFIHVAEVSGLILPLGWLLLDKICADMRQLPGARVSVNVSPTQLMTPGFAEKFANRVAANEIEAHRMEIEVTEEIVARDDVTFAQELTELRRRGFTLALDDFGTGFSSIGYLTRIPFDVLKIDQSFVRRVHETEHGARMVRSMVGIARAMDLEVVAEGIETDQDVQHLRAVGADYFQGYYFGKPAPVATFEPLRQSEAV